MATDLAKYPYHEVASSDSYYKPGRMRARLMIRQLFSKTVGKKLGLMLLASLIACSNTEPVDPDTTPTRKDIPRPITKIVQTLNLTYDDLWSGINGILQQKGIQVAQSSKSAGVIKTAWIPMSDSFCGSYPTLGAPLPCQTQYTFALSQVSPVASSFTVTYVEQCTEQSQLFLECPNSNAERLMKSLVEEIKTLGGVLDLTIYRKRNVS